MLVVGAACGGVATAESLRSLGHTGQITVLGAEGHLPYDRPPLSKEILVHNADFADVRLRPTEWARTHNIDLKLSTRARRLDLDAREVETETDEIFGFDQLVIATGLGTRGIPGWDGYENVHSVRTWDDAIALRSALHKGRSLVVIGAGVLGCEIAASANTLGLDVTLVDVQSTPMKLQLGPTLGAAVARLHQSHGVRLLTEVTVDEVLVDHDRIRQIRLGETMLDADLVVVAIGGRPQTDWLEGNGLDLSDGVLCDERLRAADGVYAVGDVARFHHTRGARLRRLENRSNATEQALVAATNIIGSRTVYDPLVYYWTDQHEVKIQAFGDVGETDPIVTEGSMEAGSFVAEFREGDILRGVVTWNHPAGARMARKNLIATRRNQQPV